MGCFLHLALLLVLVVAGHAPQAEAFPDGFVETKLFDMKEVMGLPSLPDGRMLIAKRTGQIYIADINDPKRPLPMELYLNLAPIDSGGERVRCNRVVPATSSCLISCCPCRCDFCVTGLTSIAQGLMSIVVDPNFNSNGYVYAFYSKSQQKFRVERFKHQENFGGLSSRGQKLSPSQGILWTDPDTSNLGKSLPCWFTQLTRHEGPFHYGGQLSFGPDGMLYVGLGDKYSQQSSSQNKFTAAGCMIRMSTNPADGPPSDNWGR